MPLVTGPSLRSTHCGRDSKVSTQALAQVHPLWSRLEGEHAVAEGRVGALADNEAEADAHLHRLAVHRAAHVAHMVYVYLALYIQIDGDFSV